MPRGELTHNEVKVMQVLCDGYPHMAEELIAVCPDPMMNRAAISACIRRLRKKLPPGQEIVCDYYLMKYRYRLVRLLNKDD